jgi:hypothetical protein
MSTTLPSLRSSLSLTSTLSACIVLASRLQTHHEVFALLSFCAGFIGSLVWLGRARLGRRFEVTFRSPRNPSTHGPNCRLTTEPSPIALFLFQVGITTLLFLVAMYLWHPTHPSEVYIAGLSLAQVGLVAGLGVIAGLGPCGMKLGWRRSRIGTLWDEARLEAEGCVNG